MNQKEYKKLLQGPKENREKDFFKYRNLAEKLLNYKRNSGYTIHHLRDTPEQQFFNDNYYERWGIDFDGIMKYCVCITTEEHKRLHAISKETKALISKSVSISKTKFTKEEQRRKKSILNKEYRETHREEIKEYKRQYYLKYKEKIKQRARLYKQKSVDATS